MAVQQNKKSPSKRGMHRSHDSLTNPPLAVEPTTGENYALAALKIKSILNAVTNAATIFIARRLSI